MTWYDIFDDIFFLTFASMLFASAAVCIRYAYRSKCTNVRLCCGALEIQRDIVQEEKLDEIIGRETSIDDEEKSNLQITKQGTPQKV